MRVTERTSISTVWLEAQVDSDGIALSLISESPDDVGAVIEAVDHYSFEELQEMDGEMFTMNLSENTEDTLSGMREDANVGRILATGDLSEKADEIPENPSKKELLAYMGFIDDRSESEIRTGYDLPQVADVLRDTNPPHWSDDDRVRVIEVTDTPAEEYVIQESVIGSDKTVADENPRAPEDAPVVVANYVSGTGDNEYAFPVTRLEEV